MNKGVVPPPQTVSTAADITLQDPTAMSHVASESQKVLAAVSTVSTPISEGGSGSQNLMASHVGFDTP
ncbi:hypothetical protein QYF36_023127 [Acer negundo]|nr:hypothetical protein QYF36_023127 [Acer negundo]